MIDILRLIPSPVIAAFRSNTSILIGGNAFVLVLRLASTIFLTRILDANAFGIIGVIATVQIVIGLASDIGFYPYVVRSAEGDDPRFLDEVWTLRLIRAVALAVICFALAHPVAAYVGVPELVLAMQVAALQPLLEGLSSMTFATAAREGKIPQLSILDIVVGFVQVTGSVVLCLLWNSFWGMIVAGLISNLVKIFLSYALFPHSKRSWCYSRSRRIDLWAFGRHILPSSMITLAIGQADRIVFVRLLGISAFGYYNLASSLASTPLSLTSSYISRILYPAFAETFRTNQQDMKAIYYSAGWQFQMILLVLFGGFTAMSDSIVRIIYDDRYSEVAYYLQILAIASVLTFRVAVANEALIAVGKVKNTLVVNIVRLISLIGSGWALYEWEGAKVMVIALPLSLGIAQIYSWISLSKSGILSIRKELLIIGIFAIGFLAGGGADRVVLSWIDSLK